MHKRKRTRTHIYVPYTPSHMLANDFKRRTSQHMHLLTSWVRVRKLCLVFSGDSTIHNTLTCDNPDISHQYQQEFCSACNDVMATNQPHEQECQLPIPNSYQSPTHVLRIYIDVWARIKVHVHANTYLCAYWYACVHMRSACVYMCAYVDVHAHAYMSTLASITHARKTIWECLHTHI